MTPEAISRRREQESKLFRYSFLFFVVLAGLFGQTTIPVSPTTAITTSGTSVPGSCTAPAFFVKTNSSTLYVCVGASFIQVGPGGLSAAGWTDNGVNTVTVTTGRSVIIGASLLPNEVSVAAFSYCTPSFSLVCAQHDGSSHTISSGDIAANPQWLGTYVAGDQWDYVALQEAEYAAFGGPGAEHAITNSYLNKRLYIPQGKYYINKPLTFTAVQGGKVEGAGRFATSFTQITLNTPNILTNGVGYTHFSDFLLNSTVANTGASFELDWDGVTSVALQSNTLENIFFQGGGDTRSNAYGLRIGISGFQGSENLMLNLGISGYRQAGIITSNFNALDNTVIGGNIADCRPHGISVQYGSLSVYNTGFQNGVMSQIDVNGSDIYYENSGGPSTDVVSGVRSESARLLRSLSLHRVNLIGSNVYPVVTRYQTSHIYNLNDVTTGSLANSDGKLYKVTVAGTSGAEPIWPGCCTVASGGVTFEYVAYATVVGDGLTLEGNTLPWGTVNMLAQDGFGGTAIGTYVSRTDWLQNQGTSFLANNIITVGGTPVDNNGVILFDTTQSAAGFQDSSTVAKPTCVASLRGTVYSEKGTTGVADQPFLCAHKSDNSYAWIQLVTVP